MVKIELVWKVPLAIHKLDQKVYENLQDSLVDLTGTPPKFQNLLSLPKVKQSTLGLCDRIILSIWKNLQLWRCILNATICDLENISKIKISPAARSKPPRHSS
jgi:hypothetical protein